LDQSHFLHHVNLLFWPRGLTCREFYSLASFSKHTAAIILSNYSRKSLVIYKSYLSTSPTLLYICYWLIMVLNFLLSFRKVLYIRKCFGRWRILYSERELKRTRVCPLLVLASGHCLPKDHATFGFPKKMPSLCLLLLAVTTLYVRSLARLGRQQEQITRIQEKVKSSVWKTVSCPRPHESADWRWMQPLRETLITLVPRFGGHFMSMNILLVTPLSPLSFSDSLWNQASLQTAWNLVSIDINYRFGEKRSPLCCLK
jgi:hypothetical protein